MARLRTVRPGLKILTKDGPAAEGANDCWWGTARVLIKPNQTDHEWLVAIEYVTARLAAAIGIPVPAGELAELPPDGQVVWVSAVVEHGGEQFAPADAQVIAAQAPDLAAGVFVFDVWILNEDRPDHNLVYHQEVGLWAIDHEKALAGPNMGRDGELASIQESPLVADAARGVQEHALRGCQLEDQRLRSWGDRVQHVPRSAIERLVTAGRVAGLYGKKQANEIADFLLHRQQNIHRLVRLSLPETTDDHGEGAGQ
ncbi:HipA family kinase [Amycolatopsis sp. NPDC101161]|uniref:HipA family kinase n=1 Tax=Amycolatopsis sp. NPDC101161 TaxID=3363940 RepID=UPI0038233B85